MIALGDQLEQMQAARNALDGEWRCALMRASARSKKAHAPACPAGSPARGCRSCFIVVTLLAVAAAIWLQRELAALQPGGRAPGPPERAQPAGHPAPARRAVEPRRRRPHRAGDGDRGHHRRDRRLDQLRHRGAARAGDHHQRFARSSSTAATRQTQALSTHLAKASCGAVEADRLGLRVDQPHGRFDRGGVRQRRALRPTSRATRWTSPTRAATPCAARSTA